MAEPLKYLEIDIHLERFNDSYRSLVVTSPAGPASARMLPPLSTPELRTLIAGIEDGSITERELRQAGTHIFEALFQDQIGSVFRTSLSMLDESTGLRINLRLQEAPELIPIPWEIIFDPIFQRHLSLSERTPLIRYPVLPISEATLSVKPPLSILVVLSSPHDAEPTIDLDAEWLRINQAIRRIEQKGTVEIHRLDHASWDDLQSFLREQPAHILHFVGHGFSGAGGTEGGLILEDDEGKATVISSAQLSHLLTNHRHLRLVVLNMCRGVSSHSGNPFSSVAQALVRQGMPAAIAMRGDISQQSAIAFSQGFYSSIAQGYAVERALTQARIAIFANHRSEWAVPVLFMRARDGRLFDLPSVDIEAVTTHAPEDNRPTPREPSAPFIGTVPYSTEQSSLFFGRDNRVAELVDRVENEHSPWLMINGKSGAGKTSLLRAALVPKLKEKGYNVVYTSILDVPEQNIIDAVATEFKIHDVGNDDLISVLNQGPCSENRPLVLIIDQLERAFTLARSDSVRRDFWRSIAKLLNGAAPCVTKLVFAIRADWLYAIQEESGQLHVAVYNYLYLLEPLSPTEAYAAFSGPLQYAEIPIEAGVAEEVISDLTRDGYVNPPHLQIVGETLYRSYRSGGHSQIDLALYLELGEADTIIRNHFENVIHILGPNTQICWQILSRLVGSSNVRVSVNEGELRGDLPVPQFRSIVEHLINHSIVVRESSSEDRESIYTLTHDSLVDELKQYFEANSELNRWRVAQRYLDRGFSDWEESRGASLPLLLDGERYRYIWENRSLFSLLPAPKRDYLMQCALNLGEQSFTYWLANDAQISEGETTELTALDTEFEQRLGVIRNDFLLSDDPQKRSNSRNTVNEAIQHGQVSDQVASVMVASLHELFPPLANEKKETVASVLWALRPHLTLQQRAQVAPAVARAWAQDNRAAIRASSFGAVIVSLIVALAFLVNFGLQGRWESVDLFYAGMVSAATFPVGGGENVYAVTQSGSKVGEGAMLVRYSPEDDRWEIVNRNLTQSTINGLSVVAGEDTNLIYLSKYSTGLIRSKDNGESWQQINSGLYSYNIVSMAIDPNDPEILYAGSGDQKGVFQSRDGGDSWKDISGHLLFGASVMVMDLVTDHPLSHLVAGTTDGRLLKYDPGEESWREVSVFPGAGGITALKSEQVFGESLYAGTTNGLLLRSTDGGEGWSLLEGPPNSFVVQEIEVVPGTPDHVFVQVFGYGGNIVWHSFDAGNTWEPVKDSSFTRSYATSILASPSNENRLYVASEAGLFGTVDGGRSWELFSLGAPLAPVYFVESSPQVDGPTYVVSGGNVFYSRAGARGSDWQRSRDLPSFRVRDLLAHPSESDLAFAATFVPQEWSVFVTRNGGESWLPTALPDIPERFFNETMSIGLAFTTEIEVLYVGSNGCGVIHSLDRGASWETYGRRDCEVGASAPRNVMAIAVDAQNPDRTVVAADSTRIYLSDDRAKTWQMREVPIQAPIIGIALDPADPQRIYLVAGAELFWASHDGGRTWTQKSEELWDFSLTSIASVPDQPGVLFVSADNGEVWQTNNSGETWKPIRQNLTVVSLTNLEFDARTNELFVGSGQGGLYRYRLGLLDPLRYR